MKHAKKEYYNRIAFAKALSLQRKDPLGALEMFQTYFDEYPYDCDGYPYYVSTLITCGKIEEASKLLDEAELLANSTKYKMGQSRFFKEKMLYARIKLLAYLEKFEELHRLYIEKYDFISDSNFDFKHLNFYCKKKLNIPVNVGDNAGYMYRQIANYSEGLFLAHIQKHMPEYNIDLYKPNGSIFSTNFPVSKIVDEVKKYIPNENSLFTGFLENEYLFKYDCCGRDNNKLVDYFKVASFHNTSDLITMYPAYGYDNYPYIDLNYMKEYNDEKIKRKSAIDRFNQRYHK